MGNINRSVDFSTDSEIAVVTVDNPPVNALKHEVRAGLAEALRQARDDAAVKAVVIACAGRTFFAGADITEFGKPPQAPGLHDVIAAIEATPKPVVAALHLASAYIQYADRGKSSIILTENAVQPDD